MTNTNKANELVAKIDNFVAYEMKRSYNALENTSEDSLMYDAMCGCVDAIYHFAYSIVEGYTVQDAIDMLIEDIDWYAEKAKYYYYHRSYVSEARRILRTMENFTNCYYIENMHDYSIKHVMSVIVIDAFDM